MLFSTLLLLQINSIQLVDILEPQYSHTHTHLLAIISRLLFVVGNKIYNGENLVRNS